MSLSELKLNAKSQLNGKKKNAALVLLVELIVSGIIDAVAKAIFKGEVMQNAYGMTVTTTHPVAQLIITAVSIFLGLGLTSYFMKIARGQEAGVEELFSKGNVFLKAFVSSLIAGVLICCGCVLLIVPGIILSLAYSMITYIYIDKPEVGIIDALKESREMMKGHKWEFFCLGLSFLGWMILGVFTLGLLYFWLIPYMGVTYVNFYEKISGKTSEAKPVEAEVEA